MFEPVIDKGYLSDAEQDVPRARKWVQGDGLYPCFDTTNCAGEIQNAEACTVSVPWAQDLHLHVFIFFLEGAFICLKASARFGA